MVGEGGFDFTLYRFVTMCRAPCNVLELRRGDALEDGLLLRIGGINLVHLLKVA
jgi:hypothetical protein